MERNDGIPDDVEQRISKAAHELLKALPAIMQVDMPEVNPCKNCGRTMLVGRCCEKPE